MNVEDVPTELIPFATEFHFQIKGVPYLISRTAHTWLGTASHGVADGKWCAQHAIARDYCLNHDGTWRYKSYGAFDTPADALAHVKRFQYTDKITPGNAL